MTTSYVTLTDAQGGEAFDVTDVGDGVTEMVNELANLSLYECMLGRTITGFIGSHAGGCTMVQVRNQQTNRIKMREFLDVIPAQEWRPLETPFVPFI